MITREKAYSSYAHFADYALLAARTDPHLPRHKGIRLLIVNMELDGIRVIKHRTMAGLELPRLLQVVIASFPGERPLLADYV